LIYSINQVLEEFGVADVEVAMGSEIFESAIVGDSDRLTKRSDGLSCQRNRNPFQDVNHAQQPIGRNTIDDVIGMPNHDLAGEARRATTHLFGIAAHGVYILEYPHFVAALFGDVFEQRRLVEMICGAAARSRQGEQWRGAPDVVIGLTEKIQIQFFRCPIAQNILNQRQLDKRLSSRRGLPEQLLTCGHGSIP
jgi:hypothetical protein